VRLEGLGQLKNPVTNLGIEPATFFHTKLNHALNVTFFLDVSNIVQWSSIKIKRKKKNQIQRIQEKLKGIRDWNYVLKRQLSVLLDIRVYFFL
jgi:hypothetical protein